MLEDVLMPQWPPQPSSVGGDRSKAPIRAALVAITVCLRCGGASPRERTRTTDGRVGRRRVDSNGSARQQTD